MATPTQFIDELDAQMSVIVGEDYDALSANLKSKFWLALGNTIDLWTEGGTGLSGVLPGITLPPGTSDHDNLLASTLIWTVSAHTGTNGRLAGFHATTGAAVYYEIGADVQAWDADLDALSALATGFAVRTAADTWTNRTLSGGDGVTVTNGNGVAGNPSIAVDADVLRDADVGVQVQAWDTDLDTYAANPLTAGELGQLQNIDTTTINSTQWGYLGAMTTPPLEDGDIGVTVQAWDADLDALAALATTGLMARTAASTFAARQVNGGTGVTVTNGDGVSGNPTIDLASGSITEDLLGFSFIVEEIAASAFSHDGTRSNYTLGSSASSHANVVDATLLWLNGVLDQSRVTTTSAADEFSLSGTTLSVHGDITASGDTYQIFYISGTGSGGTIAYRTDGFDSDVAVNPGGSEIVKTWAMASVRVTGLKVHAQTVPSTAGTYTLAISGAGNNLLSTATYDMETISAATLTSLTLTATAVDLELSEGDEVLFTFVSDNADLTATGVYIQMIYEFI